MQFEHCSIHVLSQPFARKVKDSSNLMLCMVATVIFIRLWPEEPYAVLLIGCSALFCLTLLQRSQMSPFALQPLLCELAFHCLPHYFFGTSPHFYQWFIITVQQVGQSNRIPGTSRQIIYIFYFFKNYLSSGGFLNQRCHFFNCVQCISKEFYYLWWLLVQPNLVNGHNNVCIMLLLTNWYLLQFLQPAIELVPS